MAFFGCMYYAALRPEEATDLRRENLTGLPGHGWGEMILTGSQPRSGSSWTDDGSVRQRRELKHRPPGETRRVPIHPDLVALLRDHLQRFGTGPSGRVFTLMRGGIVTDRAYLAVFHAARATAFTKAEAARQDAQFHSIALPPVRPERQAPWSSQGPHAGSLYLPDAGALAGLAREWTTTPGRCWFCVWDGYDWRGTLYAPPGEPSRRLPGPVPGTIRRGPRVRLPGRDYLLYTGPVEAVAAVAPISGMAQTPNLWWPADRAWCVGTEIDLPWTYVGGPAGLIERILDDERIEALPAEPGDPVTRVEEWVATWAGEAAAEALSHGEAVISTSRGTVHAWVKRPSRFRRGMLRTRRRGDNRVTGSGGVYLSRRSGEELRDEISRYLTGEIIDLFGR